MREGRVKRLGQKSGQVVARPCQSRRKLTQILLLPDVFVIDAEVLRNVITHRV